VPELLPPVPELPDEPTLLEALHPKARAAIEAITRTRMQPPPAKREGFFIAGVVRAVSENLARPCRRTSRPRRRWTTTRACSGGTVQLSVTSAPVVIIAL
jgi:hypothetical protein